MHRHHVQLHSYVTYFVISLTAVT